MIPGYLVGLNDHPDRILEVVGQFRLYAFVHGHFLAKVLENTAPIHIDLLQIAPVVAVIREFPGLAIVPTLCSCQQRAHNRPDDLSSIIHLIANRKVSIPAHQHVRSGSYFQQPEPIV